jgi:hypothetical protein
VRLLDATTLLPIPFLEPAMNGARDKAPFEFLAYTHPTTVVGRRRDERTSACLEIRQEMSTRIANGDARPTPIRVDYRRQFSLGHRDPLQDRLLRRATQERAGLH